MEPWTDIGCRLKPAAPVWAMFAINEAGLCAWEAPVAAEFTGPGLPATPGMELAVTGEDAPGVPSRMPG